MICRNRRTIYLSDMAGYRVARAFERIPEITGLELTRHGNKWQGPYYIDGTKHMWRRDKLKFVLWKNDIYAFEEGGRGLSLVNWLIQYGGCADFKEALRVIEGQSSGIKWTQEYRQMASPNARYVDPSALEGARNYDLNLSPLFRHMCTLFDESRVREVWNAYNVTANSKGATIFWYLNPDGKICHDKVCWYKEDGHRDKNMSMGRQFRIGDGYTENPMFGSHFKKKPKGILEAEKSALYASCYYGGVWLATGGKGNLRDPGDIPLYPDRDAEEAWSHLGTCIDWYSDWPECGDHSDLADKIEWEILHNRK